MPFEIGYKIKVNSLFKKLQQKTSPLPLWLFFTGFLIEFLYQFTCGACAYTGRIQWWQIILKDGALALWVMGLCLLIWNLITGIFFLLKGNKYDQ
jgi:hypothetical protein